MLAVNYSTIRNNLKSYCDQATDNNETVIVTRKNEKNIRGIEQLSSGGGSAHELIEVDDE